MFERLHSKVGRTHKATYDASDRPKRELAPAGYQIWDYSCIPHLNENLMPLRIIEVDLLITENTDCHHTDIYEITRTRSANDPLPQLIVRRGQMFYIELCFNRIFSYETDEVSLTFQFGDDSVVSKGSKVTVSLNRGIKPHNWSAGICKCEESRMTVQILTPPDCIIGKCSLMIDTKRLTAKQGNVQEEQNGDEEEEEEVEEEEEEEEEENIEHSKSFLSRDEEEKAKKCDRKAVLRYFHQDSIYILFNPWHKDDQVYMPDENLLDEYVLCDKGKIHIGTLKHIVIIPWNFAQFERVILDCCLYLLDATHLRHTARGNAINVVRNICLLVNSFDDKGLLVAKWCGQYGDGVPPTQWLGSLGIFEQFWETKLPVKYGQCWVFAAVATTICRCLGIPTRCVTNYLSAHDCDGSNTINMHWNLNGEPIESLNSDHVWSFHVWNESYMTRSDLPGSFAGWQVFDPTPQEASDGVYCAGPCPVQSLKRGEIYVPFNGSLIFSEFNTNRFHWILKADGTWRTILQKDITGKNMLCDVVNNDASTTDANIPHLHLLDQYKFPEGIEEWRATIQRANTWATNTGVYDKGDGDIRFTLNENEDVMAGEAFDVQIQLQNKSRFERNVKVTLTLLSTYYTGLTKAKIKTESFNVQLCSLKNQQIVMRILAEEYAYSLTDHTTFQICALCQVAETDQLFVDYVDFRLTCPTFEFEAPETVRVGEFFDCTIKLFSQMPIDLTECQWMVEVPGALPPTNYPQNDLEPYEKVQLRVPVTPQRPGKTFILASFHSKQLAGIKGSKEIEVFPAK